MKSTHTKVRTGKIARLPDSIRDELNRRLQNNQPAKPLLNWLNALPEVEAILKDEFEGRRVTPQNLSEWRQGGFKDWQMRNDVLQFARNLDDENAFGHKALAAGFSEKLARWLMFRFVFAAQNLAVSESDPRLEWARLRELCADVARLRRGDLYSEHLRIQRDWLALKQSNAECLKEKQFWAWTERPDIKEKLYPSQSAGMSDESLREMEEEFLGMTDQPFFGVGQVLRDRRLAREAEQQQATATDGIPPGDQPAANKPSNPIQPDQT